MPILGDPSVGHTIDVSRNEIDLLALSRLPHEGAREVSREVKISMVTLASCGTSAAEARSDTSTTVLMLTGNVVSVSLPMPGQTLNGCFRVGERYAFLALVLLKAL